MKPVDVKTPWEPIPWTPIQEPKQGCNHVFSLCLYVPPGKTVMVSCPHCGAQVAITGSGAIFG